MRKHGIIPPIPHLDSFRNEIWFNNNRETAK